jgi:hypothetical protein
MYGESAGAGSNGPTGIDGGEAPPQPSSIWGWVAAGNVCAAVQRQCNLP